MAVNQIEEDEGPLEAEDVGPDPYDDDEADTVAIKGDYKKQASSDRATAAPPTFRARPCPPPRPTLSPPHSVFGGADDKPVGHAGHQVGRPLHRAAVGGAVRAGDQDGGHSPPHSLHLLRPLGRAAVPPPHEQHRGPLQGVSPARHHQGRELEEGEGREGRRRPRARVRSSIRQGTAEPRRALERDCSTCSRPLLRRPRPAQDSLASFEDRFGTTVAVASLSLAVCVNAAFSLMRYFDNV